MWWLAPELIIRRMLLRQGGFAMRKNGERTTPCDGCKKFGMLVRQD